jgi:UMF1 family MFS transporter
MKFNKIQRSWAMYSWAKSVYSLVISTVIFPIYYEAITTSADSTSVFFLGMYWENTVIYSYTIASSYLVISLISPFLGALADYYKRRKFLLVLFLLIGGISTSFMFVLTSSNISLALFLSFTASIGFAGSYIFYNSYLPIIASKEQHDSLSGFGFSMGYFGSAILLIFCLVMITYPEFFGIADQTMATRFSFLITGLWWLVFGLASVRIFPIDEPKKIGDFQSLFRNSFEGLFTVFRETRKEKFLKLFLSGFFWFSTGMQTIILLAAIFGAKVIGLDSNQLIGSILIIQFVAIFGVYLFTRLSKRRTNIFALLVGIIIWLLLCMAAYFVQNANQFYVVAGFLGLVLGAVQSLSRSTYSKMLPKTEDHSTFFSFYDVMEKLATTLGMFSIGILEWLTGDLRNSALALSLFFAIGLVQILRLQSFYKKSSTEAV